MIKGLSTLLFLVLLVASTILGAQGTESTGRYFAGMPTVRNGEPVAVFDYRAYSVGYSEEMRTPVWSAYVTFSTETPQPSFAERPRWQAEPSSRAHVLPRDIPGQPWKRSADPTLAAVRIDKGHMTPLADIAYRYGLESAEETFRMVNVVPQLAANNQGAWQMLESKISGVMSGRGYRPGLVDQEGRLWVITGPIFSAIPPSWARGLSFLPSGVPVPSAIFKVVFGGSKAHPKVLCVILPNESFEKDVEVLRRAVVPLRAVEDASGLDLAPEIPQVAKDAMESMPLH